MTGTELSFVKTQKCVQYSTRELIDNVSQLNHRLSIDSQHTVNPRTMSVRSIAFVFVVKIYCATRESTRQSSLRSFERPTRNRSWKYFLFFIIVILICLFIFFSARWISDHRNDFLPVADRRYTDRQIWNSTDDFFGRSFRLRGNAARVFLLSQGEFKN